MCQYVDLTKLVYALPESIEDQINPTNHYNHPEIKIELPVCAAYEELIDSGETKSVQSCTILYNCPESHYISFVGMGTNIGLYTLNGVLKQDFSGYFHVTVYYSNLESFKIPIGTYLGSLRIKKFYNAL